MAQNRNPDTLNMEQKYEKLDGGYAASWIVQNCKRKVSVCFTRKYTTPMKTIISRDVAMWSLEVIERRFKSAYCLRHQSNSPWRQPSSTCNRRVSVCYLAIARNLWSIKFAVAIFTTDVITSGKLTHFLYVELRLYNWFIVWQDMYCLY